VRRVTLTPSPDGLAVARRLAARPSTWRGLLADGGGDLPPAVTAWLANVALLDGVPFNYLVPDDRMLPPESVRFFYVDSNWLAAARDGALSIGRTTSFDLSHDEGVAAVAELAVGERAAGERARRLGAEPPPEGTTTVDKWQTGLLLRSALVEGWPGLELVGFADADGTQYVGTAHHTLLSPSVMLCLFAGIVERVDVVEPQEGILFGATHDDHGNYTQTLRSVGQGGADLGDDIPGAPPVSVPIRAGAKPGVVDVATLAGRLHQALEDAKAWTAPRAFDAADFAVEMIEPPQRTAIVSTTTALHVEVEREPAPRPRDLIDAGALALDQNLREELGDG
jgi:hypothetical protein